MTYAIRAICPTCGAVKPDEHPSCSNPYHLDTPEPSIAIGSWPQVYDDLPSAMTAEQLSDLDTRDSLTPQAFRATSTDQFRLPAS